MDSRPSLILITCGTCNNHDIQNKLFDDQFFLHISTSVQNRLRIRSDDEMEYYADLKIKKGKLEFYHPNKINFYLRGSEKPINKSNALVSMTSATIFQNQPKKCKQCVHSIIPEIEGIKYVSFFNCLLEL